MIQFPDFFTTVFDVPMDDEHTASYLIDASPTRTLDLSARMQRSGLVEERFYQDNTFVANWNDRFGQDREAMRNKLNWSGFHGITQEDSVISRSMGAIYDRSKEHLVSSDAAIVQLRRRLMESARANAQGQDPFSLNMQDMTKVIGFDADMDDGTAWRAHAASIGLHPGTGR